LKTIKISHGKIQQKELEKTKEGGNQNQHTKRGTNVGVKQQQKKQSEKLKHTTSRIDNLDQTRSSSHYITSRHDTSHRIKQQLVVFDRSSSAIQQKRNSNSYWTKKEG